MPLKSLVRPLLIATLSYAALVIALNAFSAPPRLETVQQARARKPKLPR